MRSQFQRSKQVLSFTSRLALAVMLGLAPAAVSAEALKTRAENDTSYYVPGDGGQRINMSGKLRMLSQRIPGMACHFAAGIAPDQSFNNLQAAATEFETILHALTYGNDTLGITSPEPVRMTLHHIELVEQLWTPFVAHLDGVDGSTASAEVVEALAVDSAPLLSEAKRLVSRIVSKYFDPIMITEAEAITIDFAGRQRMLAQRMSKNMCLLQTETHTQAAMAEMTEAHRLFDATLAALYVGMPDAGLTAPPNDAVVEGLYRVSAAWEDLQPALNKVMAGDRLDDATWTETYHALNALTAVMNETVQSYSDASARNLS